MLRPYSFEPHRDTDTMQIDESNSTSDSENTEEDEDVPENRTEHINWCSCTHCSPMVTDKECKCCDEINEVARKKDNLACITNHNSFDSVCLNREVLWTAMVCMKDVLANHIELPVTNR